MLESQILWTALPRSADAQHLELDIFVSPRLGLDATKDRYQLSEFPDWEHWTKTLDEKISFTVEFADGSTVGAQVIEMEPLDHVAWDALFPPDSFVRPWSFKDLSKLPIYSFPVRFVTAYLRDRYQEIGRAHPTRPPGNGGLGKVVEDLGAVTDVRVPEERKPPPRDPSDLPIPEGEPEPTPEPAGCIGFLWRFVRWLILLIRKLLGLPPPPTPPPDVDPTKPKTHIPRVVHPSPYESPSPPEPFTPPALAKLEQEMAAKKVVDDPGQGREMAEALACREPALDFTRALRFYERPESKPPKTGGLDPTRVRPRPTVPELDFHQALGALGDYPKLLRRLGLVVRLRIPRPAADPKTVRVLPAWNGQPRPEVDVSPRTCCKLDGSRFRAQAAESSDLDDGLLDLTDASDLLANETPRFDLVQIDADGAALKAILTAASLKRKQQHLTANLRGFELPAEETLPALRSGGLAVVRPNRAFSVHGHLVRTAALAAPVPATGSQPQTLPSDLCADDLVRGYRVEVSSDGGTTWSSLCWRVGSYRIVEEDGTVAWKLENVEDEGYVKGASVTSEPGEGKPLYLHETVVRWAGWSLTVPRPGKNIGRTENVERPSEAAKTEFRLEARFKPKARTLPRLRYGDSYRVRMVCVDLAGEPMAEVGPGSATSRDVMFRRFEPVEPPALLPLRSYSPGESLERLVIRSDFDTDAETYETTTLGMTADNSRAQRTRHFFPPKTSQLQAELHKKMENAFGQHGDPDAGYRIALRESGTFRDAMVIDVNTVDVANPLATIPFGQPTEIKPGNPDDPGAYFINREDGKLPTPYLPDPIVAGVALRGVPGLTDTVDGDHLDVHQVPDPDLPAGSEPLLQIPFTGTWPDLISFRLRVAERTMTSVAPHWNAAQRLLTVFLGKAERAEIRYSSYLAAGELDNHGVWDWLDGQDPLQTLRKQALFGAHWMISPPRRLVVIHAVQRPLEIARFTALQDDPQTKAIGQTWSALKGNLHMDVASTERIDVIGKWDEWRDEFLDGKWPADPKERKSVAFNLAVQETWPDDGPFPPPGQEERARHEFGDTKHRTVHYYVRATTRFREYFPEAVAGSDGKNLWRPPEEPVAPTELIEVNVLSSSRPDAPRVLYIVPTFEWKGTPLSGWTTVMQERRGGGLRVYLERGDWFSSGGGELLGVILVAAEAELPPDDLRTRYGADATWAGAVDHAVKTLMPEHFTNRTTYEPHLPLAENPDVRVTVVGFKPEPDNNRGLLFCDIDLAVNDLGWNYWPFIRLAFVRYQPDALDEAKLSPVVVGEYAQLAPDRQLSVVWQGSQKVTATLRGRGPYEQTFESRVAFLIQAADPSAGPVLDELDWEWVAGAPEIVDDQSFFTLVAPTDPAGDGELEWTIDIDLPFARGARPMRLAVREYEFIQVDHDEREELDFDHTQGDFGRGIPRISYASAVPLD